MFVVAAIAVLLVLAILAVAAAGCAVVHVVVGGGLGALGALGGAETVTVDDLPELAGLPASLRRKIVVNPATRGLRDNPEFLPAVGNSPELQEIDRAISAGCVKALSMTRTAKKGVVDGYKVLIYPRGSHIHKSFLGFLTEDQVRKFAAADPDRPSWFGDKYLAYAIARSEWGSIVSFRLEEDLVMMDYYDPANLERLIAEVREHGDEFPKSRPVDDIVKNIRNTTGFGLTPAEQAMAVSETYPKWREFWYYTEPMFPKNTATHCDPRTVEGLDPISGFKGVHSTDVWIFKVILAKHPGIDGLSREAIRSRFDEPGVYYHEEHLIKGSAQLAKLKYDRDDPIGWPRWKLKDLELPKAGISLDYSVGKFISSTIRSKNHQFALVRFYTSNAARLSELPEVDGPHVLSYNVHGFRSLNADIRIGATRRSVADLVGRYRKSVEFVVLTEVRSAGNFRELVAGHGFKHWRDAANGSPDSSLKIAVVSRAPLRDVKIVDTDAQAITVDSPSGPVTFGVNQRKQIVFTTAGGLRGAALQLEIGRRHVAGDEDANKVRIAWNVATRIRQLEQILDHSPDFLIGDFNFTLDDPEAEFLREQGFVATNTGEENSTPYNRVDHFFVKAAMAEGLPPGSNHLLRVNYSDHLPMLQTLP